MNWEKRFADRARMMQQSTVREFLKHAARPGIISFAGGLPDPELLPVDETRAAVDRALTTNGTRMLQYGVTEGIPELRERIAHQFREVGATPENVLITTGSQQALDLVGRVLLNDGAKVAVQNPTYLAALSAWRPYGARFMPGEERSPLSRERNIIPDLIYCIPNFNNPTGESLGHSERNDVLKYSLHHSIPLIEDDPYGDLRYDASAKPASLLEAAGDLNALVIHIGTLSKILAPGFRIGWIVAARDLVSKLAIAKQSLDLHTSTFTQYVAVELFRSGTVEKALPQLLKAYSQKRDALLDALKLQMRTSISWTRPNGGFFLLLTLPPNVAGSNLARAALDAAVLVVPGDEFHIRNGKNTLRLCFSNTPCSIISEGISRLTRVIECACTEKSAL